jgi:hypothetical protein
LFLRRWGGLSSTSEIYSPAVHETLAVDKMPEAAAAR